MLFRVRPKVERCVAKLTWFTQLADLLHTTARLGLHNCPTCFTQLAEFGFAASGKTHIGQQLTVLPPAAKPSSGNG